MMRFIRRAWGFFVILLCYAGINLIYGFYCLLPRKKYAETLRVLDMGRQGVRAMIQGWWK